MKAWPNMLRQISFVAFISAVIPIAYILGWAMSIEALAKWPTWLIYVWPSEIMLLPWGGQAQPGGAVFFLIAALSVVVNAVLWCLVLVPVWRALMRTISSNRAPG